MRKTDRAFKRKPETDYAAEEKLRQLKKQINRNAFNQKKFVANRKKFVSDALGEPVTTPKKGRVKPPWTSKSMNPFGKLLKRPD